MPRPKPLEPLKGRQIRLCERHIMIFQELGGIAWLRKHLDSKAKFPIEHYRKKINDKQQTTI
jgi:hypothetical protein